MGTLFCIDTHIHHRARCPLTYTTAHLHPSSTTDPPQSQQHSLLSLTRCTPPSSSPLPSSPPSRPPPSTPLLPSCSASLPSSPGARALLPSTSPSFLAASHPLLPSRASRPRLACLTPGWSTLLPAPPSP